MLFLLFQLGNDHYALDAGQIVAVLPLVDIKKIPQAPLGTAGIFNYRGTPVPVIDLNELTIGQPAQLRLSTRLILVNYPDENDVPRLLGLIAEKATETLRSEAANFTPAGVSDDKTPYLGPVITDPRGLIQWIKVKQLLPATVRDRLFREALPNR